MYGAGPTDTRPCPNCGKEIRTLALQCRYCRAWFHEGAPEPAAAGPTPQPRPAAVPSFEKAEAPRYSDAQPVRHLVWLAILSFGLYELYWFYRNWRAIKAVTTHDFSPGWRTAGLFVPIANVFMVYHLFRLAYSMADTPDRQPAFTPGRQTLVYFLLVAVSNVPGPFWPLTFLTVLPMIPVQAELNRFWAAQQPERPVRETYSSVETVILALGMLIMMVVLFGMTAVPAGPA